MSDAQPFYPEPPEPEARDHQADHQADACPTCGRPVARCEVCRRAFAAYRADQRFCTARCRSIAWRARQRDEAPIPPEPAPDDHEAQAERAARRERIRRRRRAVRLGPGLEPDA